MSSLPLQQQPQLLVGPITDTADSPTIRWGGSALSSSGTGLYGDYTSVSISVSGTRKVLIDSTGITATITGNVTGTASLATQVTGTTKSDNVTYYPTFVAANSTGSKDMLVGPMTYNPSTGALTTTTFVGALSGNATTATSTPGTIDITGSNVETITSGAISITKPLTKITGGTGFTATLAAPGSAGQIKMIQLDTITSGTVDFALTNVVGARKADGTVASTACTFTNAGDAAVLLSVAGKWVFLSGSAVCT